MKARAAEVQKAVRAIRAFWAKGRRMPGRLSHKDAYDQDLMAAAAEREGLNPDTARKARMFHEAYSKAELDELCATVKGTQSAQERGLPVFGKSHVIRLLSVRHKGRRRELLGRAVAGAWSTQKLEEAIATEFGPRRGGGRAPYVPTDPVAACDLMEKMLERWRRWLAEVRRDKAEVNHVVFEDLPKPVRTELKTFEAELDRLHAVVEKELGRKKPGRTPRDLERSPISPRRSAGRR